MKLISAIGCVFFVAMSSMGQETDSRSIELKIYLQIEALRTAHLRSDTTLANTLYHPDLILTSQSGKKYNKKEVLENIKNTFEYYEYGNADFLRLSEDVILTNYINERKYKDLPKGAFRITTIWKIYEGSWRIISMQSSKIK